MIKYFLSFTWGIYILLSLIGWGTAINYLLFPKYRVDWGQRAAWGLAFSICFGGFLNITGLISRPTIFIYLILGFLFFLIDFYQNRKLVFAKFLELRNFKTNRIFYILFGIIILLFFINYAGWVYSYGVPTFNVLDDYQAYFAFPRQMLQIGSIGSDPFNARRILSSLGGQSFLHTFILIALREENLNIIDPGIALPITAGLILPYLKENSLPKSRAIFLILFLLFLPFYRGNTSSTITTTVLFLSLFRTFDWDKLKSKQYLSNACIIALTTAAICALKSSNIPACSIFLLSNYIFYLLGSKNNRRGIIYEFLLSIILIFVFLSPWMILMYQSSGTLLYPLLGKGYHGSVYSNEYNHYNKLTFHELFKVFLMAIGQIYFIGLFVLGIISIMVRASWKIKGREALFSLLISALLGTIIIALAVGEGPGVNRYPIPFVNAAIITMFIDGLSNKNSQETHRFWTYSYRLFTIFFAIILLVQVSKNYSEQPIPLGKTVSRMEIDIKKGLKNIPLFSKREMSHYRTMQKSIPEGETILTRLDKPFLLDFKRNTIFIADWPGEVSPPPGMPLFQGSEALADYFLSQSIRYLVYSYANEANVSETSTFWRKVMEPQTRPWLRNLAKKTFDFQDNLTELGRTRKRIYDDGKIFVLDLEQRKK